MALSEVFYSYFITHIQTLWSMARVGGVPSSDFASTQIPHQEVRIHTQRISGACRIESGFSPAIYYYLR